RGAHGHRSERRNAALRSLTDGRPDSIRGSAQKLAVGFKDLWRDRCGRQTFKEAFDQTVFAKPGRTANEQSLLNRMEVVPVEDERCSHNLHCRAARVLIRDDKCPASF